MGPASTLPIWLNLYLPRSLLMTRARRLSLLMATAALAASISACSGDDTAVPLPPVNDAGPAADGSLPPSATDGGDAASPPATTDGGDAGAVPTCSSLPGTIVYIESADTQEALLDTVGRELRDKANITLVFLLTGSCTVTPDMYGASGPVAFPANTSMLYIPSTLENGSWTPAQPEYTCTTGAATPAPDLGISALFPSSCAGYSSLPQGNIAQYIGPTQAYTFVVPSAEYTGGQTSISEEEAYYAFGDGTADPVTVSGSPDNWNAPTQFFLRPSTKSTLVSTALNIHLTPTQMVDLLPDGGTADGRMLVPSSGGVLSGVAAATSMQAIGILGDEVYDENRSAGVHTLALQTFGQSAAYFPDSTPEAFDKQNIRDGHYTLWSPDVYMAPSSGSPPVPTNPSVAYVLDIILGNPNPSLPGSDAG
ncbi:MAG: hypothetical protein L3J81_04365, partial [Thermoplasmata archaeon]|nr:hypothetical protein [Thermoplasmata archaeon]